MEETAPLGIPEVMAAINTCQAALANKIEVVQLDIGLIQQDLDKIGSRLTTAECRGLATWKTTRQNTLWFSAHYRPS